MGLVLRWLVLALLLLGQNGGIVIRNSADPENGVPPTPPGPTTATIPLTVQEAIYTGVSGITRTAEPVTVGIPLPDSGSDGATAVNTLTISGATIGQFRALGYWPSGRIKWVLVDTLASVAAGGTSTALAVTNGGNGSFGGSSLATDNGTTITIATGAATFTIKKANFNGFDQVVVGATTVVATGASTGLVVMGPASPGTTCGTCTTVYSSANDASSTATIEENGPVRAVVKATGSYKDGSGNAYLKFTVRMHFYKGLTRVRAVTTLRNADYGASSSFATAYKGMAANEWRLTAAIAGTRTFNIGKASGTVETGTLTGTDDVYLYSAYSSHLENQYYNCCDYVAYTADTGWALKKNGSSVATGTSAQPVAGWADIQDASGVGVSIGVEQMAAYWPKSLEFKSGGSDVRIGIWPSENTRAYHQAWPQWSTHDLYFNFHAAALSSPTNEFLKFQHPLLARASVSHYNTTAVFPYPIVQASVEDAFFASTYSTRSPASGLNFLAPVDATPGGSGIVQGMLQIYRNKYWAQPGESNQQEFRYNWLVNFLQRGFAGRYLHAKYFYRFLTDDGAPHSDGYSWIDHAADLNVFARPTTTSTNSAQAYRVWGGGGGEQNDQEHYHWYGMPDYYFLSGAEEVKDAILDGYLDYHLSTTALQAGGSTGSQDGMSTTRAEAVTLIAAARLVTFLNSIGDSADSATVLANAKNLYEVDSRAVLCTNAEAASQGCTAGNLHDLSGELWPNEGISRTRGVVWHGEGVHTVCGTDYSPDIYRVNSTWSGQAFTAQGLYELSNVAGSAWTRYWEARDLAYGMIQGAENEEYVAAGSGRWDQDGWRVGLIFDTADACDPDYYPAQSILSHWLLHYIKYDLDGSTDWVSKLRIGLLRSLNYTGQVTADYWGYQLGAVIAAQDNPTAPLLQSLTITSFTNNGSGSYTIGWTVPSSVVSYRIKWGAKQLVDLIGFNPGTNAFTGNPTTTMNWFAATNVTPPTPGTPGTTQTTTISTGNTGLTAANFSVKAYVSRAPTVAWSTQTLSGTVPHMTAQQRPHYDGLSGTVLMYMTRNTASGIYSTDYFSYTPSAASFVRIGGTGSVSSTCDIPSYPASVPGGWNNGAGSDVLPWPSDRHPDFNNAIDTSRNQLYQFSSLACNHSELDTWRMTLNANPASNTWVKLTPATTPNLDYGASMAYHAAHDVIIMHGLQGGGIGFPQTWQYCPDPESNGLSAAQTAAGCVTANNWVRVYNAPSMTPTLTYQNNLHDDPVTGKVLMFGVYSEAGAFTTGVWSFDPVTHIWSNENPTGAPSNLQSTFNNEFLVARMTSGRHAGKFLFHRTSHSSAGSSAQIADYLYDSSAKTFTALSTTGIGPDALTFLVFVPTLGTNGGVVAITGGVGQTPTIWHGILGGS